MKAIVINGYGGLDLVELKEVDRPQLADDGILVRVQAAGVNAGDLFTVKGSPWLVRFSTGFPRSVTRQLGFNGTDRRRWEMCSPI